MELRLTGIRDQVEKILPRVQGPARYTGGESGEARKDHSSVQVLFALAFPDVYEVGMSNLGLKILYHTLNRRDDTAAERVFAPAADMESEMREAGVPLYALESLVPIKFFNIIGFSLAYELTYTNVLNMLDLAGIPLKSANRDNSHPLIIAGGHCTVNPEPMTEFIDAFVIGDGEEVVHEIVNVYKDNNSDRQRLLTALAGIKGVYVPSLYRKLDNGRIAPSKENIPAVIKRAVVKNLDSADYPDNLIIPFFETIHDRAVLEIMRGCTRTCRFCQAGMITRPVRERSVARLEEQAEKLLDSTGYDEIGLMSLSSADYSGIQRLVKELIGSYEDKKIGISLPSIRADSDCVRFAAEIEKVRKTGLTFAPEAGTQRLRDVINKNVTEEDLLEAVDTAIQCGWRKVKLYFMIGLPTETDEDVEAIADLVYKVLSHAKARRRPLTINVGVSSFVPKPHTPFQWRGQEPVETLNRKIDILKNRLRNRSILLSWHDTQMSELEAILANGGRELNQAIMQAWKSGAKFDGWDDRFNPDIWQKAFESTGADADFIAHGAKDYNQPLPWEHIDTGVTKNWLRAQDLLADRTLTTRDCRSGTCLNCGIEQFTGSDCSVYRESEAEQGTLQSKPEAPETASRERVFYRLTYSKDQGLRWLGHMDLVRVFERGVRRSRLPVAYSEGFNPRPRLSFYSQLSVGMTGESEPMTIELTRRLDPEQIVCALNSSLPEGLRIRAAAEVEGRRAPELRGSEFIIGIDGVCNGDLGNAVKSLLLKDSIIVDRRKEHESKKIDIRPGIESLEARAGLLLARLASVRPVELVDALRNEVPSIEISFIHRIRVY